MVIGSTKQDPRTDPAIAGERDIRPVVERPRAGLSGLAIGIGAIVAALLLFFVLDARRRALVAPATVPQSGTIAESATPPPLYIPPQAPAPPPVAVTRASMPAPTPAPSPEAARAPSVVYLPSPAPADVGQAPPPRNIGGPALVVDNGVSQQSPGGNQSAGSAPPFGNSATANTDRAHAAMFANRATTVPQGTIVPAILETALDSSRAGFARALVQRDIRGFDGTHILIPRGSRLIGQYAGDVAQGQKRAFIAWARLIRPDGVTIALDSPAADPVGRGGVKADVNNHFFARFSGAILQSVLDVGVNLASRSSRSPVIVALPGSLQGTTGTIVQPTQIAPTLTVKPGTSVSVFVARDLDFSGSGGAE